MSSQRPPWQISSCPKRPGPRWGAGRPCNAHLCWDLRQPIFLLTRPSLVNTIAATIRCCPNLGSRGKAKNSSGVKLGHYAQFLYLDYTIRNYNQSSRRRGGSNDLRFSPNG
jgi:hypothetical protein